MLARGHRWLATLTSCEAKAIKEIAAREGVGGSYVGRMLNLTTLAPDIAASILDAALPSHITLFELTVDPPVLREERRGWLLGADAASCRHQLWPGSGISGGADRPRPDSAGGPR